MIYGLIATFIYIWMLAQIIFNIKVKNKSKFITILFHKVLGLFNFIAGGFLTSFLNEFIRDKGLIPEPLFWYGFISCLLLIVYGSYNFILKETFSNKKNANKIELLD